MAEKKSKRSVNYSPGMDGRYCRTCSHFIRRQLGRASGCEVTSSEGPPTPGRIDPGYWCEQYERDEGIINRGGES